jgi:hypothetical protein
MSSKTLQDIEEIFHAALELSGEARIKFLDQACGNFATLRGEVESLLAFKERTQSPLKTPVVEHAFRALAESDDEALIGKTIDHYKILSRIGEGGRDEFTPLWTNA